MITIENIRAMMIKHPSSRLWSKSVKTWSEGDKKVFKLMLEDKLKQPRKQVVRKMRKLGDKRVAVNAVKVMRVSDGKIYTSISDCKDHNDFHDVEMRTKLKLGIEFKKQ